jgi:futalosine hydrolase
MTSLLLVSATALEIEPVIGFLSPFQSETADNYVFGNLAITVCVTGVGMVNTAFSLGRLNGFQFGMAINAGLAGSFGAYKNGDVVSVPEDCFSELGAEDDVNFLRFEELGFGQQHLSLRNRLESRQIGFLPSASGITVNTVHGNDENIERIKRQWNADVETMEGAAFIHAANFYNWKAVQVRAISNIVEKRDKSKWDIPLAIRNLNAVVMEILKEMNF